MFKLAAAVIDFYDDPEFLDNPDARALFGESLVPPESAYTLRDKDFAVKIATVAGFHRKFPIYNRAATAISGRYFDKIAEELPEEIKKTAGYHLKAAHQRFNLPTPTALCAEFETPDSSTVHYRDSGPRATLRETDAVVKIAQHSFMSNHNSYPLLTKIAKAIEIEKAAASCGSLITESAVWDYVPKDEYGPMLKEALLQRETLVNAKGDGILKEAFHAVLDEMKTMSPKEAPFLIFQFDKKAGFDQKYGPAGIVDPFFAAWGGFTLPKKAGAKEDLRKYKLETVARHRSMLENTFGERLAAKFARDPEGTYDDMTPAEKKVIDFLMDKIPSDVSEKSTEPTQGGPAPLWREARKVTDSLAKEQKKPSERPTKGGFGSGMAATIDEGL